MKLIHFACHLPSEKEMHGRNLLPQSSFCYSAAKFCHFLLIRCFNFPASHNTVNFFAQP